MRSGRLSIEDPETLTRLLLGALTRGAMLIANSSEPVVAGHSVAAAMRALLDGFVVRCMWPPVARPADPAAAWGMPARRPVERESMTPETQFGLDRLDRERLATLVPEFLLAGHLIDRAAMPHVMAPSAGT